MDFQFSDSIVTLYESFVFLIDSIFSWIPSIFEQPILLIGLGIFVAGAVIGLVYRLIRG